MGVRDKLSAARLAVKAHRKQVAKAVPGELLHRCASYIIILEGVLHTFAHAPLLVVVCAGGVFLVYEIVMIVVTDVDGA